MKKMIALVFAIIASASAFAHHSPASYDTEKKVAMPGIIKSVAFRNPHSEMVLLVTNAQGVQEEWAIEFSAAVLLRRRGWKFDQIKPGDKVIANGFPNKSGEKNMYMLEIQLPDGTLFGRPDDTKVLD